MCTKDVWILLYKNAGKTFVRSKFQTNADMLRIRKQSVPVESTNRMTIAERVLGPLQRSFKVIRRESVGADKDKLLRMAIETVGGSVGPYRLVPTLMVLGAQPRLGLRTHCPTPSTLQKALALTKATAEMSKFF